MRLCANQDALVLSKGFPFLCTAYFTAQAADLGSLKTRLQRKIVGGLGSPPPLGSAPLLQVVAMERQADRLLW